MLKLYVENTEAQDPTMRVRWCVDPELFRELQAQKAIPHILIVVYNVVSIAEYRYVEKLSALTVFIPFRKAGENIIYATICWNTEDETVSDRFLAKGSYRYNTSVLKEDHSGFLSNLEHSKDFATATVHVDEALFPKQPFDWGWVNRWFTEKPVDQCEFRKRRIFAYTAQPILLVIGRIIYGLLMNTVAFFTLLWGRVPNIDILNPFGNVDGNTPDDVYRYQPYYFDRWYSIPFRPVILIAVCGIAIGIGAIVNATYLLTVLGYAALAFAIFMVLLTIGYYGLHAPYKRSEKNRWDREHEERRKRQEIADAEFKRKLKEEYQLAQRALCLFVKSEDPLAIPDEAQTAKLRFNGIKRRVCRPYAA